MRIGITQAEISEALLPQWPNACPKWSFHGFGADYLVFSGPRDDCLAVCFDGQGKSREYRILRKIVGGVQLSGNTYNLLSSGDPAPGNMVIGRPPPEGLTPITIYSSGWVFEDHYYIYWASRANNMLLAHIDADPKPTVSELIEISCPMRSVRLQGDEVLDTD